VADTREIIMPVQSFKSPVPGKHNPYHFNPLDLIGIPHIGRPSSKGDIGWRIIVKDWARCIQI